jgi:energy-coupling factor transporter ATP-binding protein EcfA2
MQLLETNSAKKGALFARLVGDVFLTLGYESPRMNIQKTGREIDLKARHRLEPKLAIAECKATKEPIGGADLNKFAGVLQGEKEAADQDIVQGYFISLSGFTEPAIEQENEFVLPRFVLLDGREVEQQLIAGHVVTPPGNACQVAGRLAAAEGPALKLIEEPELLAHEIGWLWLCRFEVDHEPSRFALIHADGLPLGSKLAQDVVLADQECNGDLAQLAYLHPDGGATSEALREADKRYREYLLAELGEITLEGLPADEEVGAKRIALEDLYVPLRLRPFNESRKKSSITDDLPPRALEKDVNEYRSDEDETSESLGSILARSNRLAVLASPGAGKSTLIKRLAVAYVGEQHRVRVADDLPDFNWFPIFIRCRSLPPDSRLPIHKIIEEIPQRGEFPELHHSFKEIAANALRNGSALILIDGLDEIADESDRLAFVRQLRTFLATYPHLAVVVTSREAGFRAVGGALSTLCDWYRIDDLNDDDIQQLTRAWHLTVVGKSVEVVTEAENLAATIISTDRVRRLARNPLLLTTLLLVKRWVGDLPRKRSILYEKAIEVLLMTWNVEAHEPIDREEAIPQLAFVAHWMTEQGEQRISSSTLARLLTSAREQMPEVLGFARTSVSSFVERVETRSSLLIITGHVEEQGKLVPVYEFRHLTFQEYLAAVAIVEGYYEGHTEVDRLIDQMEPHLTDPHWFEVIALAVVLAGRSAKEMVAKVLAHSGLRPLDEWESSGTQVTNLLARSLADEVQLPPEMVAKVAKEVGCRPVGGDRDADLVGEIVEGRYGKVFVEAVRNSYLDEADVNHLYFATTFMRIEDLRWGVISPRNADLVNWISNGLAGEDEDQAIRAAFCAMLVAFRHRTRAVTETDNDSIQSVLSSWASCLITWCEGGGRAMRYAAVWALAWLGDFGEVDVRDRPRGLRVLLDLWRHEELLKARRQAAWAFASMPPVPVESRPLGRADEAIEKFVEQEYESEEDGAVRADRVPAAVALAYYTGVPWSEEKLMAAASKYRNTWGTLLAQIAGDRA